MLDTTDPAAITRFGLECDPATTLHLASSKSGSTIETRSHLEWAWERAEGRGRFAVITDPGSELGGARSRARASRRCSRTVPTSAAATRRCRCSVSCPASSWEPTSARCCRAASTPSPTARPTVDPDENPALELATAIAAGVRIGRDKVTFLLDPSLTAMGLWIEQLVAESLGKDGTGAVPIVSEPLGPPDVYGDDRLFLSQLPDRRAPGGRSPRRSSAGPTRALTASVTWP